MPGARVWGAGTTDRVSLGAIVLASQYSIALWANVSTVTAGRALFTSGRNATDDFATVQLRLADAAGNLEWRASQVTTLARVITASPPLTLGTWHFIVCTYDNAAGTGGVSHIYIGTRNLSAPMTEPAYGTNATGAGAKRAETNTSGSGLFWGNRYNAGSIVSAVQGSIAQAQLFNGRALTLAEAESLRVIQRGKETNCVDFKRFGIDAAGGEADYSGTGNVGALTGTVIGDGPGLVRRGRRYI